MSSGKFQPSDLSIVAASLLFFFGGAAFGKKESFLVRKNDKMIHWSRKGIFGTKQGRIPFEEIRDIAIQKTRSGASYSYRVEVVTHNGSIPVSCVYSLGAEEKCRQIQQVILETLLGQTNNPAP